MATTNRPVLLKAAAIVATERIRPRECLNMEIVAAYQTIYAEAAPDPAPFPPLDVFAIDGQYFVSDGFHRLLAVQGAGISEVLCRVFHGTEHEAMLHAAEANAHNPLPYTFGDKARILQRVLADPDIWALADRAIARRFGMSHTYVAKMRRWLEAERQIEAELATVATPAHTPLEMEKAKVAGFLGVPIEEFEAAGRLFSPSQAPHLRRQIASRMAKGEKLEAVKRDLASQVRMWAAFTAPPHTKRHPHRRDTRPIIAPQYGELDELINIAGAGWKLEERVQDLLRPAQLASLLLPILPGGELPTPEALGRLLEKLTQTAAFVLEQTARATRQLYTAPESPLVREVLAMLHEAHDQGRDPEDVPRPYPSTAEDKQALRAFQHRHHN